jgi:hypothetical protein
MNTDGDTRRLIFRWLLSAFFSSGERVETQAVLAASTMA